MEGALPRSVNYSDTLPLAVASTQNRRSFFPVNGQSFTDTGSNQIRIDVNADGLLDVQQSYLEFTLRNNQAGAGLRTLDQGHVWIKRLTIESAGVILEDINNYNRLVCGILQPAQGSAAYTGEIQLSMGGGAQQDLVNGAAGIFGEPYFTNGLSALVDGAAAPTAAQNQKNGTGALAAGDGFTGQYHLACAILNIDKYLPLVLMGQGFTISIELAPGIELGCSGAGGTSYEISNVRYVAHVVDMARDFYDMLRNLQVASGGSLMIGGSTFRHFTHTMTPGNGTENINISARVRSLENIFFVGNETANFANPAIYKLSTGSTLGMDGAGNSWNLFIGAVRYPTNRIDVDSTANKGQAYQELRKCFGALGSINHGGLLNSCTYLSNINGQGVNGTTAGTFGQNPTYGCFGLSLKSWRHELEDGIDTSSRALPCRLEITSSAAGNVSTVDIFAQATILFYINLDGSVSSSV
jgi:hypothetical protein